MLVITVVCTLVAVSSAAFGPVSEFDVDAYVGRWYQTYASSTVKYTFEAGGNCVTADYGAVEGRPDVITVRNSNLAVGVPVTISGYAVANPSQVGELQVNLGPFANPSQPSPFGNTNYLVFGLGPIVGGKYDYAMVSDPKKSTLYVLARNVSRFRERYETDVLQRLQRLGFASFLNKPLATRQDGCTYKDFISSRSSTNSSMVGLPMAQFGPVSELNVQSYLGRWYQTYASSTVKYTFEAGGNCVTADYGAVAGRADVITVKNSNLALGLPVSISGYAIANPSQSGELQVNLGPFANPSKPSPFSNTNYLVFELGPIVAGKYDYALVSDPKKSSLYVLVRDVSRFRAQYEADVLARLTALGFTSTANKPLATRQDGCKYNKDESNILTQPKSEGDSHYSQVTVV